MSECGVTNQEGVETMKKGIKGEYEYDVKVVLEEIFRMRMLTTEQLGKVIFSSDWYASYFMREMENQKLVRGQYLYDGRRRVGKGFVITDTGIAYLRERGVTGGPKLAKHNVVKRETAKNGETPIPAAQKRLYLAQVNNIYAELTPYGIHVYDSREWKKKYNLDRTTSIRGGIKLPDGTEYGFYLLAPSRTLTVEENGLKTKIFDDYEVSDYALERTMKELESIAEGNSGMDRVIIFCGSESTHEKVVKQIRNEDSRNVSRIQEILVLPYQNMRDALDIIRLKANPKILDEVIRVNINTKALTEPSVELHGRNAPLVDNVAKISEGNQLVLNFLTYNYAALRRFELSYSENWLNNVSGTRVVTWNHRLEEVEERLNGYTTISYRGMDFELFQEKLEQMVKPKKIGRIEPIPTMLKS